MFGMWENDILFKTSEQHFLLALFHTKMFKKHTLSIDMSIKGLPPTLYRLLADHEF